ncbi:MAG: rRNA maturation RNase YbeY [Cyclobacteriaceae bacterium]|nr:rRNA maturation RNase YbeY [Cyclobacteriaceae bacterium]
MASIRFFSEGIPFKIDFPRKKTTWIKEVVRREKKSVKEINYIFCSDEYLLQLNQGFLNHTTLTDIITFDNSEDKRKLEGEIYISIDRVRENAFKFKSSFEDELRRVMIHGVLHLIGYKDKKPSEKAQMRKKEEACLSLWRLKPRG